MGPGIEEKKKALKQTQTETQWFYYTSLQHERRKKKARLAKEGRKGNVGQTQRA